MTRCPLMEITREVRSPPIRQLVRYPRKCSGLDKVILKQGGKELHIFHRNWIILWWFLSMILWIELLRSLLSRLLYAQWLALLLEPLLELWRILHNCQWRYHVSSLLYLFPKCYHLFTKLKDLLFKLIHFLCLYECLHVRAEFEIGHQTTLLMDWPCEKEAKYETRFLKLWRQHDAWCLCKTKQLLCYRRTCQSNCKHHSEHSFHLINKTLQNSSRFNKKSQGKNSNSWSSWIVRIRMWAGKWIHEPLLSLSILSEQSILLQEQIIPLYYLLSLSEKCVLLLF